ncbi:uncharacterized protein LOC134149203 [Rhea pennata]|uniref:uncharacterized protein LOC134149203 n=1 Tax=Rhea pennata TaxID=8795 RepID=UPI002E26290D
MPSGNPAEETKGSIKVTAYDCKHCDISVCEFSNFSCCAVIGETQNKIFSNEVIQLVTDETYVTMCFQQAYTFPEGIYAIIWAKAEGIGDSCGILKAEELGSCGLIAPHLYRFLVIFTQQTRHLWHHYHVCGFCGLCCSAGLLVVHNHIFTSEENEFLEHSPDFISAREGDSISIICSMKKSENEVGTYLRTSIQPTNIVYLSSQNTSFILPALADRTSYSNEGKNLRVTLRNIQENDSNIYLCSNFIKESNYVKLNGKTTMLVVRAKNNGVVEQSPLSHSVQQGQSLSITCSLKSSHEEEGIFLLKTHVKPERVLYVSRQNISTIFPAFANRLDYTKREKTLVIILHNLQKSDSDVYVCVGVFKNSAVLSLNGSGTMVLVNEMEQTWCSNNSWSFYGLITAVVLLISALVCCVFYHINIKKYFQKRKPNAVYEDMSYGSRRNTLVGTKTSGIKN